MQDYPPTGLKPTHRTGRTATLLKSSAAKSRESFSPITIFRPMALNARNYTTTTAPTKPRDERHHNQPIASGSKDFLPPAVHDDGHTSNKAHKSSSTSSVDNANTTGRHPNFAIFSTPKVPFLYRKLDRSGSHRATLGIHEDSQPADETPASSPYQTSTKSVKASKSWATSLRARTVSSKSGSAYSQDEDPAGSSLPGPSTQGTRAHSDESLESGLSNQRVVGRGGSGSRPRVVVAEDQMPTFEVPTRKGSLSPEQQPVLRPSGRGGLASRPQPLAPQPPTTLPKSIVSNGIGLPPTVEPVFIRPGGRGGAGSRGIIGAKKSSVGANSTPSKSTSLLARLQKRKLKSQLQREQQLLKGKSPAVNYGVHPVRDSMADRIVNSSASSLSTIQFSGDPQPRPHFFPDEASTHTQSVRSHITLTSLAPEDMSWTPTNTFSSSNSDCLSSTSMNDTPDDESHLDAYYIEDDEQLQETRPTTPTYHHQRTLNKLTRTLGEVPSTILHGPPEHTRPKLAVTTAITTSPSRSGKIKSARRASISLSVSSIFMRPRRGSTASDSTEASAPHDLHLSSHSRWSDAISESRGIARDSYSTSPGSPMIFSAPSPTTFQRQRQSQLSSPPTLVLEVDTDEGNKQDVAEVAEDLVAPSGEASKSESCETISPLPSPVLSRSQSVTLNSASRRQSTWLPSHAQSASMSLLDAGASSMLDEPQGRDQGLPLKSHPEWLFPPEDPSGDPERGVTAFSAMLRRQRHETRIVGGSLEQGWTGEWNSDLQDVIRSLRNLH